MKRENLRLNPFSVFLFISGVLFLLWITYWTVDIPNADDFDFYLQFVLDFQNTSNFTEIYQLLITPHNEHHVTTSRLAALLSCWLLGYVNFRFLIILGTLSIFVTIFFLYQAIPNSEEKRSVIFLPVILVIFQPSYLEATQWATAAIANLWILLFALLAFRYAQRPQRYGPILAIVCTILAIFTQGNGSLVPLAIAITLALQRRFLYSMFWVTVFSLAIVFLHANSLNRTATGLLDFSVVKSIGDYFASFLGSFFGFFNHKRAIAFGSVLPVLWVVFVLKKTYRANAVLFSFFTFLLMTALANALARHGLGIDLSYTTSRYTLVSALAFSTAYLIFYSLLVSRKIKKVCVSVTIAVFLVASIVSYLTLGSFYKGRTQVLEDSMLRWQLFGEGLSHPVPENAKNIFQRSIASNNIRQPVIDISKMVSESVVSLSGDRARKRVVHKLENTVQNEEFVLIDGWGFVGHEDNSTAKLYIVLLSKEHIRYVFAAKSRIRPDVVSHFRRWDIKSSGFLTLIHIDELPKGRYSIHIASKVNDKLYVTDTKKGFTH